MNEQTSKFQQGDWHHGGGCLCYGTLLLEKPKPYRTLNWPCAIVLGAFAYACYWVARITGGKPR
jgi:hypothetical protein